MLFRWRLRRNWATAWHAEEVTSRDTFTKSRPGAPKGFFSAEAAGLAWLAEPNAVPVVRVVDVGPDQLLLERLEEGAPDEDAARAFGRGLARLHDSGAPAFGWSPADSAWFGPLQAPFSVPTRSHERFGTFWAQDRLKPLIAQLAPQLRPAQLELLRAATSTIQDGAFDEIAGGARENPARVHGDLWSGNLMWVRQADGTARGTLIDPAAHGGHRLEDLAMLHLFGAPHLAEIEAGYHDVHPLPAAWREDIPTHQLFGLLAHVHLFGTSYVAPTLRAAEAVLARA